MLKFTNGLPPTEIIIKRAFAEGSASLGKVIIYLTDDGLVTGNALFTIIHDAVPVAKMGSVSSNAIDIPYGGFFVSSDKKTLTVFMSKAKNMLVLGDSAAWATDGTTVLIKLLVEN